MGSFIEKTGKTVDLAISEALSELNLSADEVVIEVLDEGESGGLLGFGRKPARIRIYFDEEAGQDTETTAEAETFVAEEIISHEVEAERESGSESESTDLEIAENAALDYLQEVLGGMGMHGRISSWLDEGSSLHIEVEGEDLGPAIGRRGETLDAIQYLTNLAANAHTEEHVRIIVDIAGYRQRQNKKLHDLALRSAERVLNENRKLRLKPMTPAERREIHLTLADYPGITTWSEGYEPIRCIVIGPEADEESKTKKEDYWDDNEGDN
ncbi:MAG: protein jag [Clostridiaceae bacterium]|jgi:spoIIIJ-associated protein|nr:protein jag [Clostridiaceae bacterium]